ncbi:MAG: ATPase, partial [Nitrospirae bacterium CG_4_9_14_3_um_filter_51_5]
MTPPFPHTADPSVVHIGQVALRLARPLRLQQAWMGDQDILRQLLACWFIVDEKDVPLSPRIVGQPGVGKTTLAMAATQERKQEL